MNHEITLEVAETMILAAKRKAEELKIEEDIAVVDASGNLKAFVGMDGAWLGSIGIAIRKLERPIILIWRQLKSGRCRSRGSLFTAWNTAMAA
jgi:uncharacterized protein GlcG (DUF336 family)